MRTLCSPTSSFHDYGQAGAFGGSAQGFYDLGHCEEANGRLSLQSLHRGQGDLCAQGGTVA